MRDFTTFERTAPVGDATDPIRKHMKKFKCQACKKDKFHIPLKTVDGRSVCIHCCMTGKGQDIVLDKRTVDALEAVANRINGHDNYPPKAEKKNDEIDWKAFKRELYWKYVFPDLAPAASIGIGCLIILFVRFLLT